MDDIGNLIETEALPLYLGASESWTVARSDANRRIYIHTTGARVFVPMQREVDFPLLASVAINEIATAEQRTQEDVVVDMVWMRYDKVHVRRESHASSLLYSAGVEMHQALGDLILAGARAASETRAAFVGGRRPRVVEDYLDRVRMIPSAQGSFVVRALLPLSWGSETPTLDLVGPANPDVRNVSTTILRATNAAVVTAQQVAAGEADMNLWEAAVGQGVSSNLCDALTGLVGHGPDAGTAEVRISWTWAIPRDQVPPVEIPAGLGPVLEAGADYLRGQPDEHTVRITGLVTKLHRESATGPGEITVRGYIESFDSANRTMRCELDGDSYRQAIGAHDAGNTVTVTALVRRGPRGLEVLRVEDLRVIHET